MEVPEASVDENHFLSTLEHHVGMSGQIRVVTAESKAHVVRQLSHEEFGLRILRANQAHALASLGWCHDVQVCPSEGKRWLSLQKNN
ncbi:MAG: hypothetical protein JWO13_516 [Acidobacteriales bacterium]|nr:hypothetical protein [Terriglobales bacterium]